jgi:hypothetical protein
VFDIAGSVAVFCIIIIPPSLTADQAFSISASDVQMLKKDMEAFGLQLDPPFSPMKGRPLTLKVTTSGVRTWIDASLNAVQYNSAAASALPSNQIHGTIGVFISILFVLLP